MNISNFSFKKKLSFLQLLPLAGLLLFAAYGIFGKANLYIEMTEVEDLSIFATKMSSFVHEMQKERGATAVYLGSNGEKYGSEVKSQRTNTDQPLQTLNSFLQSFNASEHGSSFENKLSVVVNDIAKLSNIRSQVTNLKISGSDAIGYYTSTNGKLLNLIGEISSLSTDSTVSNINTGYVNLLKGKERAGIERAVLSKTFATDEMSSKGYDKFSRLNTEQSVFFDSFQSIATPSQTDLFKEKLNLPVVAELQRMRDVVYDKKTDGNFQMDVDLWFKTATTRINDLKEIENSIASDLIQVAQDGAAAARNTLILFVSVTLAIVLASLYFGMLIGRNLSSSINQLKSVMTDVEKNSDLSLRAEVGGNDEIAHMGEAFNKMLQTFSSLISNITVSSHQLSTSAEEMSAISESSTQAIMQQLSETEQIATASTQMSASGQEVARNANEASNATRDADEQANAGNRLVVDATSSINSLVSEVERTTKIIHELEEGSTNIGSVLDVIRGIAEQTNLLALNAAIEAARAGEQGRGFAVVADEVRNLASRTQESTEEIQTMIEQLQQGTSAAVKAMEQGGEQAQSSSDLANQATESINEITSAVSRISEMNVQIANAAEEQSTVAEEISRKIVLISTISHQASDGAQQTVASSSQVASLANELKSAVSIFKT